MSPQTCSSASLRRRGFTLIEMVVVVLILGIVAAVAVPRLFSSADNAGKNATRQKLASLRTAIEVYRSEKGEYPTGTGREVVEKLQPYINGPFPVVAFGANKNAEILIDTDTNVDTAPATGGEQGWVYKPANGQIKLNISQGEGADW